MNICLISQEFPPHTNWGGVGIQFDNLARALCAAGYKVTVVARMGVGAPVYEQLESGVDVWRVGVDLRRKRLLGRTLDRILHAKSVASKVEALDADHRFDVVEAPEAGLDAESLIERAGWRDRVIISCHGSNRRGQVVPGFLAFLHRVDWRWSVRREGAMLRRAQAVVVNSDATRREVLDGTSIDPAKVHLVYLGIDTSKFRPATARPASGPLNVGFVGRLQRDKGIDFVWKVVEAFGPEAGLRFHFKGAIHPAHRKETIERLERYADFVEYHRPGDFGDMPDFYRSLDVLLLPSRFESFGLAYVEAMATGLVVFAGAAGAGPEIVTDGATGFLVDPDGDIEPTVSRLRALARDRDLFSGMSLDARREVVRHFSVERFAAQKMELFEALRRNSRGITP